MADISNGKRLTINTLFLYIRMIFVLFITLFTSRIILNNLGVVDFGVYNVVAGVITFVAFLNTALQVSAQRYLSFEIGKGNEGDVPKVLKNNLVMFMIMAIIIFIIIEPFGYIMVNYKLTIPPERLNAANIVLHTSSLILFLSVLQSPFTGLLASMENFRVYSIIGIIEAITKFLSAYLIVYLSFDRLIIYGYLLLVSAGIIFISYQIVCIRLYPQLFTNAIKRNASWKDIYEIAKFSGWNVFGALSIVTLNQGLNILLNIFFSPIVNAARAISQQINSAVYAFVANIHAAIIPQLTKSYAEGDRGYMRKITLVGCKFSYYLILILFIPLFYYSEPVLQLWLGSVPEYASNFVKLTLLNTIIDPTGGIISGVIQATGKIRNYQVIIGVIFVLTLPISYIFLKLGYSPYIVFIVNIVITLVNMICRFAFVKNIIQIGTRQLINYLMRIYGCLLFCACFTGIVYQFCANTILGLLCFTLLSLIICSIIIIIYGLNKEEKLYVLSIIVKKIKK